MCDLGTAPRGSDAGGSIDGAHRLFSFTVASEASLLHARGYLMHDLENYHSCAASALFPRASRGADQRQLGGKLNGAS